MSAQPKVYLITGCSSGFGYEIALKALAEGHNVIASSRNPSRNADLVEKITSRYDGRGKWVQLDVTSPQDEIRASIADAEKMFGGIDVLVNNAGANCGGLCKLIFCYRPSHRSIYRCYP